MQRAAPGRAGPARAPTGLAARPQLGGRASAFRIVPTRAIGSASRRCADRLPRLSGVRPRAVAVPRLGREQVGQALSERYVLPPGHVPQVADAEDILAEHDACGVGLIASLKNEASHDIIEKALISLGCMEHRGGCSSDNVSGDGAGILSAVPWALLQRDFPSLDPGVSGVAMLFFPDDDELEAAGRQVYEAAAAAEGFSVVGWREVPLVAEAVGAISRATMPRVRQLVVTRDAALLEKDAAEDAEAAATGGEGSFGPASGALERALYLLRRRAEREAAEALGAEKAREVYACSVSSRTIVYKGMLNSNALGRAYPDLRDPLFTTSFAVYHRRYSTNTTPRWPLAQPMRVLGHNGEINTLQGNLNWVASREGHLRAPAWHGRERDLVPLCSALDSDSANLDRLAELLVRSGTHPADALLTLVPEAYRNHPDLDRKSPAAVDFYRYHEGLQEGWDGPALLVYADGRRLIARLDRNGLRPARFWADEDGLVHVASEVGVLGDVLTNASRVVEKGRLGPGQMLLIDVEAGTLRHHDQVLAEAGARHDYPAWLAKSLASLSEVLDRDAAAAGAGAPSADDGGAQRRGPTLEEPTHSAAAALKLQAGHGLGAEDVQLVLESMATSAAEPIYCMGDDAPHAVLSRSAHPLVDYLRQRFAQVTNPPIDPLREGLVMSLEARLGARGNVLVPGPDAYRQVALPSPMLLESELLAIERSSGLGASRLEGSFPVGQPGGLEAALDRLCEAAIDAARAGSGVLVISDRAASESLDPSEAPIPTLLATGAVHHALIRAGLRDGTSLAVESGSAVGTHAVAALVGYGANAVCPYLALESVRQWRASARTNNLIRSGKIPDVDSHHAQKNYLKAIEKGLLKILSKVGISLLSCYHGAQIFEAHGLGADVVDKAFRGTVSRIGGVSFDDLQRETEELWARAFPAKPLSRLDHFGFVESRPKGEYHANNQAGTKLLHKAIGLGSAPKAGAAPAADGGAASAAAASSGRDPEAYAAYVKAFEEAPLHVLRDLLEISTGLPPVPVDEVEPIEEIVRRFCTGGMSLGAISQETHETIAVAMNRLGGKSNSGEGGEDPARWKILDDVDADGRSPSLPALHGLRNGDTANSRIKQVASGRFGVTPEFLVNAEQLEIKVAQGAKPGEGGQLPGKKVSPYIAALRRSKPGVPLISPPPHHDIYSIEDLAQLIYDLHQVSPTAKVSVKLVAQAGIGTVASGVAKAGADVVQVSGHDGGTGASPISSLKHAGGPVEMGLAEVHQTLVRNGLRDRVVVRVDGGMRRGRDVLVAAALGGDEFGFGTTAMIATGCIMARVCHTNNCPVGVASQREDLRARFPGTPGDLVNYLTFVAEEVRHGLAAAGLRGLDELVGKASYLRARPDAAKLPKKTSAIDLSFLTSPADPTATSSSQRIGRAPHDIGPQLDDELLADPEIQGAISSHGSVARELDILNVDRSSLGRLSGAVAKRHGDHGFRGSIDLVLRGSAGQSFGAFLVQGIRAKVVGEANDYVAKGMAGGEIAVVPPPGTRFDPASASIVGNTCLYGATGGALFVLGRAGERFAVRNSNALAVVEGAGDHCCEYMTGGVVVALGDVGRNVAAGMTGGLAYLYDPDGRVPERVNAEIVACQRVPTASGAAQLRRAIERHVDRTGSTRGRSILDDWEVSLGRFWQLVPPSEANTPEASAEAEKAAAEGALQEA